jgi:hypothetical protein
LMMGRGRDRQKPVRRAVEGFCTRSEGRAGAMPLRTLHRSPSGYGRRSARGSERGSGRGQSGRGVNKPERRIDTPPKAKTRMKWMAVQPWSGAAMVLLMKKEADVLLLLRPV